MMSKWISLLLFVTLAFIFITETDGRKSHHAIKKRAKKMIISHRHSPRTSSRRGHGVLFVKSYIHGSYDDLPFHQRDLLTEDAFRRALPKTPDEVATAIKSTYDKVAKTIQYEDCPVGVAEAGTTITLTVAGEPCKDVMSVQKVFTQLTGNQISDIKLCMPAEVFNVDKIIMDSATQKITFESTAKEEFNLLPDLEIKVSQGKLKFSYPVTDNFAYTTLVIDASGKTSLGGVVLDYTLVKKDGEEKSTFNVATPPAQMKMDDFYKTFDDNPFATTSTLADVALIYPTLLKNLKIRGSVDSAGTREFVLQGTQSALGATNAQGYVFIYKELTKSAGVAIILDMTNVGAPAILSKLLKNRHKYDEMAIIKDLTTGIIIEYSNQEITPLDEGVLAVLKVASAEATVKRGMKIKVPIPLGAVIKKYDPKTTVSAKIYINIEFFEKSVVLEFPGETVMEIINVLYLFLPNIVETTVTKVKNGFGKLFKGGEAAKIVDCRIDVTTGDVKAKFELAEPGATLTIAGKELFKLDKGTLTLQTVTADGVKNFNFQLTAQKALGTAGATIDVDVTKEADVYTVIVKIDKLSMAELQTTFKMAMAQAAVDKLASLQVAVDEVVLTAKVGPNTPADVKVTGKVVLGSLAGEFEGHAVEAAGKPLQLAYGILLKDAGIGPTAAAIFGENKVKKIESKLIQQVTVGLLVQNEAATAAAITWDSAVLNEAFESKQTGVTIDMSTVIPQDCGQEKMCAFLKKVFGADKKLRLVGNIASTGITIELAVSVAEVMPGFKFSKAALKIEITMGPPPDAKFSLEGTMRIKIRDKDVDVTGGVSVTASGSITLKLATLGAFNPLPYEGFTCEQFQLEAGVNLAGIPEFEIFAKMNFGKGTPVDVTIAGGFGPASGGFYFKGQMSEFTLGTLMSAVGMNAANAPQWVKDTGFKTGFTIAVAIPKEKTLPDKEVIKAGVFFQGELTLLGIQLYVEINVNPPTTLKFTAKMTSALEIAGGALKLSNAKDNKDGPQGGPEVTVNIGKDFELYINAAITVLSMRFAAVIHITTKSFLIEASVNFLGLFEIMASIQADYSADMQKAPGSSWKIQVCIGVMPGTKVEENKVDAPEAKVAIEKDLKSQIDDTISEATKEDVATEKLIEKHNKNLLKHTKKVELIEKTISQHTTDLENKEKELDVLMKNMDELKLTCAKNCQMVKVRIRKIKWKPTKIGKLMIPLPKMEKVDKTKKDTECLQTCVVEQSKSSKKSSRLVHDIKVLKEKIEKYEIKKLWTDRAFKFINSVTSAYEKVHAVMTRLRGRMQSFKEHFGKYITENVIFIERLCLTNSLDRATGEFIFGVSGNIWLGGKLKGQPIKVDITLTIRAKSLKEFVKELVSSIVKKHAPDIKRAQEDLPELKKEQNELDRQMKKVEEGELNPEEIEPVARRHIVNPAAKDRERRLQRRFAAIPVFVTRNDITVRGFQEAYEDDDDNDTAAEKGNDEEGDQRSTEDDIELSNQLAIDPSSFSHTDDVDKCKQAQDVMGIYEDIVKTIKYIEGKNKEIKEDFQSDIRSEIETLKRWETTVQETARANNFTEEEIDDARHFVKYGADALKQRKTKFDKQFAEIEKETFKNWKKFVSDYLQEKNIDPVSFGKKFSKLSKLTAMRWQIPDTKSQVIESLSYADQIMGSLLRATNLRFSERKEDIETLKRHVDLMAQARSDLPCTSSI